MDLPKASRPASGAALAYSAHTAYIVGMAILNIRRLADETHAQLRLRAAHNGRSMEAEARDILTRACAPQPEATGYDAPEGSSAMRDADAGLSITLSPQQARAAQQLAHRQHTTLDQLVHQLLSRELASDAGAEADELFSLMDDARIDLTGLTWSRDELYRV